MSYARGYARVYVAYGESLREVTEVDVERRGGGHDYLRATTVEGTTIKGYGRVTQHEPKTGTLVIALVCASGSFVVESTHGWSDADDGEVVDGTARPMPPMLPTPD